MLGSFAYPFAEIVEFWACPTWLRISDRAEDEQFPMGLVAADTGLQHCNQSLDMPIEQFADLVVFAM